MPAPNALEIDDVLFGSRAALDQADVEVVMEQYKLFVDTSERLVARRQVVNTFFLSGKRPGAVRHGPDRQRGRGDPLLSRFRSSPLPSPL